MRTLGKVVDASVLVGATLVGVGAIGTISAGITSKKGGVIALGALSMLIAVYAFKEASKKLND